MWKFIARSLPGFPSLGRAVRWRGENEVGSAKTPLKINHRSLKKKKESGALLGKCRGEETRGGFGNFHFVF